MFADAADAAVDAISAPSGNFYSLSTWLWTLCRDLGALDPAPREPVDPDRVAALRLVAEELVELGADEEDDGRDVEVRDDDHQQEQVAGRRLVTGEVLEEPGVDRRLDEPRNDDERRADARPAPPAVLDRRVARHDGDSQAEEDRARGPAQECDQPVPEAAARPEQPSGDEDDEQRTPDQH